MSATLRCPYLAGPCEYSPTRCAIARAVLGSRWRLSPGEQALLALAHVNKGETYTALAGCFGVGTATVFRYVREGVDVLAAVAPTLDEALDLARRRAYVILDGTLLSIDRVGMVSATTGPITRVSTSATGSGRFAQVGGRTGYGGSSR